MNVNKMRVVLKEQTKYSGSKSWSNKVDRMSDKQVMAIYYRLLKSNGFTTSNSTNEIQLSVF